MNKTIDFLVQKEMEKIQAYTQERLLIIEKFQSAWRAIQHCGWSKYVDQIMMESVAKIVCRVTKNTYEFINFGIMIHVDTTTKWFMYNNTMDTYQEVDTILSKSFVDAVNAQIDAMEVKESSYETNF